MATNNKANSNILINLFHKGMNTDTAVNMLDNEHYIYGKNVRITQYTPLEYAIDVNRTKGCITPLPAGVQKHCDLDINVGGNIKILATASTDKYGAVVFKDNTDRWYVYRVMKNDQDGLDYVKIFDAKDAITKKDRLSVVMAQELEDVVKLYVATEEGISQFNVCEPEYTASLRSIDYTISNRLWPYNPVQLYKKIGGSLPVGQVQWVYRLYKNHGAFSKLSAVTNKILIFSDGRNEALGNEQPSVDDNGKLSSSNSGIGYQLRINIKNSGADGYDYSNVFDRILLFRIQYYSEDLIKVFLISQSSIDSSQSVFGVLDDGVEPLQEYTLEEFSALEGLDIVADSIDIASQHMFAGNIKDRSSIRLYDDDETISPVLKSHTVSVEMNGGERYVNLLNDNDELLRTSYQSLDYSAFDRYFYNKGHKVNDVFESSECPTKFHPDGSGAIGGASVPGAKIKISWKLVSAEVKLHDDASHENPAPRVTANASTEIKHLNLSGQTATIGDTVCTILDYLNQQKLCTPDIFHYGDNMTSSMLRSLRRGETYRYGIVYYNKYGQRTDVQWIDDIKVPSNYTFESTQATKGITGPEVTIKARPIGVEFQVAIENNDLGIVRYQIVRCAHTKEFSKEMYQVVQNAPIMCTVGGSLGHSPWSPVGTLLDFLFYTQKAYIKNQTTNTMGYTPSEYTGNYIKVLQGPDISYARSSTLLKLQSQNIQMRPTRRLYSVYGTYDADLYGGIPHPWLDLYYNSNRPTKDAGNRNYWETSISFPDRPKLGGARGMTDDDSEKISRFVALHYYMSDSLPYGDKSGKVTHKIEQFASVKNPNWEDNFEDVTFVNLNYYSGSDSRSLTNYPSEGSELYKGFSSSMMGQSYNNWVCYNMYNLRCGVNGPSDDYISESYGYDRDVWAMSSIYLAKYGDSYHFRVGGHNWSGPGPVAILAALAKKDGKPYWGPWGCNFEDSSLSNTLTISSGGFDTAEHNVYKTPFITTIIALEHSGSTYQGTTKSELQYDTYYGFGFYGQVGTSLNDAQKLIVFDGDTYITPAEIQTMYKTYNKIASATYGIRSASVINYVPLESEYNSMLDYGENFKNTLSANVQLEPCDIENVGQQDRPQFQYNKTMSYNNYSAMSFTAQSEELVDENYPQRIFYSEQKENGEAVDNWGLFKAINYIDANSKYGPITNLFASKEILYFWQPNAFGKLSVNERSLITDENSNKIQLGTGGVLLRTDYLDTNSGMKADERAAIGIGDTIYWIDSTRRSIMKYNGSVISCGVQTATLNLLNWKFDTNNAPYISYDIQNDEVLCKCLINGAQVVYVHGLNIASSEYTREYEATITLHGILYGLAFLTQNVPNRITYTRYNYLTKADIDGDGLTIGCGMLSPMELKFAISVDPSVTKVYDNQKITVVNDDIRNENFIKQFKQMEITYSTDIHEAKSYTSSSTPSLPEMSYREGDFLYALPRWGNGDFGERIRGKWMILDMCTEHPKSDIAISQILTKVRTSFS